MEQEKKLTASPGPAGPLVWSHEQPTVEGWYFLRWAKMIRWYFPVYVRVLQHDHGTEIYVEESIEEAVKSVSCSGILGEWAGPLPLPAERGEAASAEPLISSTSSPRKFKVVESDTQGEG